MTHPAQENWIVAAAGTIVTGLSLAVVALWKLIRSNAAQQIREHTTAIAALKSDNAELKREYKELERKAEECRKDRESLRIELGKLDTKFNAYVGTHRTLSQDDK